MLLFRILAGFFRNYYADSFKAKSMRFTAGKEGIRAFHSKHLLLCVLFELVGDRPRREEPLGKVSCNSTFVF